SGATTYSWSTTSTNTSIVVTPTAASVYSVTGTTGLCSGSTAISIGFNATPTVGVSASSPTVCAGQPATLTASGPATYSWSDGSTANPLIVSPSANTTYAVTGTSLGCSSSRTVSVAVSSSLSVGMAANNPSICIGGSSTLTASGVSSYTWDSGSNSQTIVVN